MQVQPRLSAFRRLNDVEGIYVSQGITEAATGR